MKHGTEVNQVGKQNFPAKLIEADRMLIQVKEYLFSTITAQLHPFFVKNFFLKKEIFFQEIRINIIK